jgi:hypothetical protein
LEAITSREVLGLLPGRQPEMPEPPDARRLVRGPYKAPPCRIGATLHDAIRGDIVVVAISRAPIPWPLGRQKPHTKLAPIVTTELERAIRTESALAMRYWWDVGKSLVAKWRRELGVPLMNEGTARLWRELTQRRLGEHYGWVPGRRLGMKLSPERAAELKRRALAGENRTALAAEYRISRQWVSAIVRGVRKV